MIDEDIEALAARNASLWDGLFTAQQTIAELRKALEALNKSSDAVWKEINEFDKPVSSEIYGWWEQAQIDATKALATIAATEEGKSS